MSTFTIYPNVETGEGVILDDYVILGKPPRNTRPGELKTTVGEHSEIRSHTVIYAGNTIGKRFQTGHHVTIRENNRIGDNVSVGTGSVIEHQTVIADGCRMHSQTFIPEFTIMEEDVWIGPNVVLTNAKYPAAGNTKEMLSGIVLKKRAKIGANVTVLPGITIGENALVGAGSVVTMDVEPGTVVVGSPARIINKTASISHYLL